MEKFHLFYSVCQYIPDPNRQENMNIGIAFHCPNEKCILSEFRSIKNKSRLRHFDDEYDKDYIDLMFQQFKYQFNYQDSLCEDRVFDEFTDIYADSFIENRTKYYVNEFRFLPVQKIETSAEMIVSDMNDIERVYLYYDTPKGTRISKPEVQKLLKRSVRSFDMKSNESDTLMKDFAGNNIFDLELDNSCVRSFSFDYANKNYVEKEIKQFLFDLSTKESNLKDKEIIIVINNNFEESDSYDLEYLNYMKDYLDLNIKVSTLSEYATLLLDIRSNNRFIKKPS